MPYVRAIVVQGQPCLQILDQSGAALRMAWPRPSAEDDAAACEIRDAFRQLFLEGLRERLRRGAQNQSGCDRNT